MFNDVDGYVVMGSVEELWVHYYEKLLFEPLLAHIPLKIPKSPFT